MPKPQTEITNPIAKRCEVAAIERGLSDDNGFSRDLLEDAAKEIERLSALIETIQEDWEAAWAKRCDLAGPLNMLSRNYTDDKEKLKPERKGP